MSKQLMIHLMVFTFSAFHVFAASSVPLSDVKIGIEKHFAQYDLCEFTYDIKRKNPQGVMEDRKNTYRLHFPPSGFPIQCLIEESNVGGKSEIERFVAFDGKQTIFFGHNELLKGKRSQVRIVATDASSEFNDDGFVRLLATSIIGIPFTMVDAHYYEQFWNEQKDQYKFITKRDLDGFDVLVFKKTVEDCEYELHVLGPPYYMIVKMMGTNLKTKEVFQESTVEKVGRIGEIVYPQKGRIRQKIALTIHENSKFKGVDYSFEVAEAKLLERFLSEKWFPEIPPGTSGKNDITGKTIEIPFSDEQKEMLLAHAESSLPENRSPLSFVIRMLLVIAGLIMILAAIYLKMMRKMG